MSAECQEFHGPLATDFAQFANVMRGTGGTHVTLVATIRRFDRFLARSYPELTALSRDVLTAWFSSFVDLRPASQRRYRTATFQLCKFLHRRDPLTPTREDFEPLRRSRGFRPYPFSREEMARLLNAARQVPRRSRDPLRPESLELVITLLYTAGLRIGEVVRLDVRDYDASVATLVIRETKFSKSRLVPVSASARGVLEGYLRQRQDLGLSCDPEDPLVWSPGRSRLCLGSTQAALVRLMRRCGLKPASGRSGPRVHDIRHAFALHRLVQWYEEGLDVQALLPWLSTYMGHRGLESTQLYLSMSPELLRKASQRFDEFSQLSRIPQASEEGRS